MTADPNSAPAAPPAPDDDWTPARVGAALGELLAQVGPDRFLAGRIVLPGDDTFPPFSPSLPWARRVVARLMALAGLADYAVDIEPCDGGPHAGLGPWQPLFQREGDPEDGRLLAWFAGFAGDVCRLGLDMRHVTEPDAVGAALAHEVAHAYRQHHGLVVADAEREDALTHMTAVALVSGVLERAESGAVQRFLNAATRPASATPTRAHANRVDPAAPGASHAREIQRPELDTRDWAAHFAAVDHARALTRHAGLPVFRVARAESRLRILFAAVGVALATALALALGLGTGIFAAIAFGLLVIGVALGGRFERTPTDECSDCPAVIPPDAATCPGCGGAVAGRIASRDDRLGAREALEAPSGARADDNDDDDEFELDVRDDDDADSPTRARTSR